MNSFDFIRLEIKRNIRALLSGEQTEEETVGAIVEMVAERDRIRAGGELNLVCTIDQSELPCLAGPGEYCSVHGREWTSDQRESYQRALRALKEQRKTGTRGGDSQTG